MCSIQIYIWENNLFTGSVYMHLITCGSTCILQFIFVHVILQGVKLKWANCKPNRVENHSLETEVDGL